MKNKYKLLVIILVLFANQALAQDYKKEIKEGIIAQAVAVKNREFEKSLTYTHEGLFKLAPKDQMIAILKATFTNPQMAFDIGVPTVNEVGDAELIEGNYYSKAMVSSIQSITFYDAAGNPEIKGSQVLAAGIANFENTFGAENVKLNEETGKFTIAVKQIVYAISADGKTGWKFLTIEKNFLPLIDQLLPSKIAEQLKKEL